MGKTWVPAGLGLPFVVVVSFPVSESLLGSLATLELGRAVAQREWSFGGSENVLAARQADYIGRKIARDRRCKAGR